MQKEGEEENTKKRRGGEEKRMGAIQSKGTGKDEEGEEEASEP